MEKVMDNINGNKLDKKCNKEEICDTIHINVGSRDSELALKQTHLVMEKLKEKYPNMSFKLECMKTLGDKILDVALSKIGSKSLFTKELEVALDEKHVDIVVHSLKDLPTTLPDGLVIGAVLSREDPRDAVIIHPKFKDNSLESLPNGSLIGTSSLRRVAQLRRRFSHLKFESIRGNLNTRLKKLEQENKYDAIILAAAGVIRMDWKDKISQYLEYKDCMYAVGQGALAVECREMDSFTIEFLSSLIDLNTLFCVTAERAFMKHLEGGCSVPLAVHCEIKEKCLHLKGGVWSLDGSEEIVDSLTCSFEDVREESSTEHKSSNRKMLKTSPTVYCGLVSPKSCKARMKLSYDLGIKLANILIEKGAKKILSNAKLANNQPINVNPHKEKNGSEVSRTEVESKS